MITKDKLQEIATSKTYIDELTKREIITASNELNIPFTPRTSCNDCYRDQAVVLWRFLAEQDAMQDKTRKYVLRAGIDVIWLGIRINAATLTDEKAAEYIKRGFPKHFFCKINGKKFDYYASIK